MAALFQSVFVIDVLFNFVSIVYFRLITDRKQHQFDIYHACKNTTQVRCNYTVGGLVFFDKTGIFRKLDDKNMDYILFLRYTQKLRFGYR